MIARKWPSWFKDLYGGGWPKSYLSVDTETTGFKRDRDVIVELGHCIVEDGKIVDRLNVVLDWTEHPMVSPDFIRRKLIDVREGMAKDGRTWSMTWEKMKKEGIQPEKAMHFYKNLLAEWAGHGGLFVAHNGFFDEDMLAYNFAGYHIDPEGFDFPENQYMDTASIEKCSQYMDRPDALPSPGETMKGYFRRTKNMGGSKIHSSLDKHCVRKYDLERKYGVDVTQAHTAGYDAYLVHLLMEEYGRLHASESPFVFPLDPYKPSKVPSTSGTDKKMKEPFAGTWLPPAPGVRRRGQRNS